MGNRAKQESLGGRDSGYEDTTIFKAVANAGLGQAQRIIRRNMFQEKIRHCQMCKHQEKCENLFLKVGVG